MLMTSKYYFIEYVHVLLADQQYSIFASPENLYAFCVLTFSGVTWMEYWAKMD